MVKKELAAAIGDALNTTVAAEDIEEPPEEHGDYAYPVMTVAAERGEDPRSLAAAAAETVAELPIVSETSVAGPGYLNIVVDRERFLERVVDTLSEERHGVEEHSGTLLLEFSSPNVAKPMHVGHFRNNALGDALQRLFRFVGYDVTSENYLGDWGTQYGKLIYAFKAYGSMEEFEANPMEHMFELYVKFHEEAEQDEDLEEKGREWAAKIEAGDAEAVELWELFRDASLDYHEQDYKRMGVHFDRVTGESTVVEEAEQLLQEGVEEGIVEEDADGSRFIAFEELPDVVLQKADGSTLYLSRDLATLRKRKEDDGFDYNMYVVGAEQRLHFQQLFAAADRFGVSTDGCEHVSYGLLDLPEGSMSSRKGRIIRLADLLDEAVDRAAAVVDREDYDPDSAAAVGIGAVKYAALSVSRKKNIQFTWETALSFDGDSGPYLQYSNTRAKSILAKAAEGGQLGGTPDDAEHRLAKVLARFPDVVDRAVQRREPAVVAQYMTRLAEVFNAFYHTCPVLDAADETRRRRLRLVETFVAVTDTGLELLGITPLDEM